MKVVGIYAYISGNLDVVGGIEAQIVHLARTLLKEGCKVVLHCLANDSVNVNIENGRFLFRSVFKDIQGIKVFIPLQGYGKEGCIEENASISQKEKEDVVFCFGTRDSYVFDIAIGAKKILRCPLVSFVYFTIEERWYRSYFSQRGKSIIGLASKEEQLSYYQLGEKNLKSIVENSDVVIVPTHYVRAQLLAITGIEHSYKISVCYHGVDENLFKRRDAEWSPFGDFLLACRLSIPFSCDKGFLWAVEFFSNYYKKIKDGRLLVCGAGNASDILNKFLTTEKAENIVELKGFVPQADVAHLMSCVSFLLVPSMMEAGCTVVVESILSGCLPIALDCAGLAEIMESLKLDDYLILPRVHKLNDEITVMVPDEDDCIRLLNKIKKNPQKVKDDLNKAHQITLDKFTISKTTGRLFNILQRKRIF